MIMHPTLRIPYPRRKYLREQVRDTARKLWQAVRLYAADFIPERKKVKKVDQRMLEKLHYWRTNGAPTLALHDETEAFKSMADGKHYTSKKKYRNDLKAREYEEVGNERLTPEKPKDTVRQDVIDTIGELCG